jgi:hypothetical protein
MKKTLLFVSMLAFGSSFAQNCSELFISEYVEGSGNDKALEIYNPTANAIDLTGYRIERYSNGQSTSAGTNGQDVGGVLNLSGSIAPYSTFVIVNGVGVTSTATGSSPAATPALQAMADLLDGVYPAPLFMNGNDAIALFNGATMIDLLGKIGDASMASSQSWSDAFPYDGSAGAWWTKDQTLFRKASIKMGVTVNPDPFIVTAEWDSLPKDTWTGLGIHTCDCLADVKELANNTSFVVYPNPSLDGSFTVNTSENIQSIEVVNVVGQTIKREVLNTSSKSKEVQTSLPKGMYVVKINYLNGTFSQTNLVIR